MYKGLLSNSGLSRSDDSALPKWSGRLNAKIAIGQNRLCILIFILILLLITCLIRGLDRESSRIPSVDGIRER